MTLEAIIYNEGKLKILNQLLLPLESHYVDIKNVEDGWKAINLMQVRGAPGIAIVGCLSIVVEIYDKTYINKDALMEDIENKCQYLITSRPTAVNLLKETNKIVNLARNLKKDEVVSSTDMKNRVVDAIEKLLSLDVKDNKAIGHVGAETILKLSNERCNIITHCNTGSLATAGYGTALGVIRRLHELGTLEHVYCTETRPYNQGARLTAYELVHEKIPATLICDSAVAALFQKSNITAVLVGADRIAANGDTANKIGTYQIAVLSKYHNVPFYVCAPISSIDLNTKNGNSIPVEVRSVYINYISVAILRYLCRESKIPDHWYPKESKARARVDEYLEWQHTETRALCALYFRVSVLDPLVTGEQPKPEKKESFKRRMIEVCDKMNDIWLSGNKKFITGDNITIADLLATAELEQLKMTDYNPCEGRPALESWMARVREFTNPHYDQANARINRLAVKLKNNKDGNLQFMAKL